MSAPSVFSLSPAPTPADIGTLAPMTPLVSATSKPHVDIWRVDYNAMMERDAAQGWQGLGFVLGFNTLLFVVAFLVFQRWAKSARYSLYNFKDEDSAERGDPGMTIKKWIKFIWRTPIQGTEVEEKLGPEGTFYLLSQVYSLRLMLVLSAYALLILLPLYLGVGASMLPPPVPTNGTNTALADTFAYDVLVNATGGTNGKNGTDAAAKHEPTKWWSFARATIRSLPNDSPYLWVPVATCYIFTIAFLVYYLQLSSLSRIPSRADPRVSARNMVVSETEPLVEPSPPANACTDLMGMHPSALSLRSLFVDRGLPKRMREERMLYLMQEVFPGYIEDVCIVYNLAEFFSHQNKRISAEAKFARNKTLHDMKEEGKGIPWALRLLPGSMKYPSLSQFFRCCCCRLPPFNEREERTNLEALKDSEKASLEKILRLNNGAGRAFIIFQSARLRARFVRRVQNASVASILSRFPDSEIPRMKRYVRELGITRWHLSAAPEPDDIDWHSVCVPMVKRTAGVLIVNIFIVFLLLLFTSPIAVTSAICNSNSYSSDAANSVSDLVSRVTEWIETFSPQMAKMMTTYIPTLILVCINAVLLNVLQIAGRMQPLSTDSAKERMIVRTSSVYLIFNTIFVPSLAFFSIDAVLLYLRNNGEVLDMLGTLFLHNSGVFFVGFMLQRCFLGPALAMLRLTEWLKFSWERPRAVTPEEKLDSIEAWPFFTGTSSALQISILVVLMTFSTVIPIILPIGALYFFMQHAVDKYLLLHVRSRIKGRGSIARTATHATITSLLIYQMAMSGFFLVRGTKMQSSCVLVLLMVTYIVTLWWYIRDKDRARTQTTKGYEHVHGPQYRVPSKKVYGHGHPSSIATMTEPEQSVNGKEDPEKATSDPIKDSPNGVVNGNGTPDNKSDSNPANPNPAATTSPTRSQTSTQADMATSLPRMPSKFSDTTSVMSFYPMTESESDAYRADALRKYGKNGATIRAAVQLARRTTTYGTYGRQVSVFGGGPSIFGGGSDNTTPRTDNIV